MFRNFSRPADAAQSKVVPIGAAAATAIALPVSAATNGAEAFVTDADRAVMKRLELKGRLHDAVLERLNLNVIEKVDAEDLRREVTALVSQVLATENTQLPSAEFKSLVDELLHEVMGLGPLEPLLADPTINDILVNGHRNVYVERFGVLERAPTRFRDEKHLLRIIDKIVSRIGRRVDESQPWVDARLEDGSRVNAVIRPCAIDGPSVSIRKFAKKPYTMERLIDAGALTPKAAQLLKGLVEARLNVIISGGTGSGKTTMLNAMSSFIDERERIVTIEDAAELQLQQAHVVRLETRPPGPNGNGAVLQRDLVRNALRMRPDRIIIGECRGAETFDMLQAMNTGHDGSMTTVHANTARDALGRLEQMVTMTGIDFPQAAVRNQIASGLHVVVQLSRLADGRRRVMSVSEITGMEGSIITMQDIFIFRKKGRGENGEVLGDFIPTGIRPRCADQLIAAGVDLDASAFMAER